MKKRTLKVLTGIGGLGIAFCIAMGTSAVTVSAETEYEYDDLNRLTEERHDDGTVIYYSYDANGNLLDVEIKDGSEGDRETPGGDRDADKGQGAGGDTGNSLGGNSQNTGNNTGSIKDSGNGAKSGSAKAEGGNMRTGIGNTGEGNGNAGENGEDPAWNLMDEDSKGAEGKSGEDDSLQAGTDGDGISGTNGDGKATAVKAAIILAFLTAASGGVFLWKKKKNKEKS